MLYFDSGMKRIEKEFSDPGIPESGTAAGVLTGELKKFLETRTLTSPLEEHATAFAWLLEHIRIGVTPDDLFVTLGFWGIKPIEVLLGMPRRQYAVEHLCRESSDLRKRFGAGKHGFLFWDFAHSVPDWNRILDKGFSGILEDIREAYARFKEKNHGNITAEQELFFHTLQLEYSCILKLLDRIIIQAEKVKCQSATLEALRTLRRGRAENFYEAMLLIWLFYQLSEYGDCIQTRSFGNLDQMLFERYKKDLDSGKFTKDDIRQIIRNFYARVSGMKYYFGHPFYLGGTLPDGSSGFNELSALLLEEYGKMNIYDPKIQIKLAENTPVPFIDQALELIRSGRNSIVFVGEPCIMKTMLRLGYSAEEARTAVIKGCYEFSAPSAVETAPVILNMPEILLALLKEHADASTFDDLLNRCSAGYKRIIDDAIFIADDFEKHLSFVNPAPLFSGVSPSALANGKDGYGQCAGYNNSNIWFSGPITAADSLIMIKKYVYDQQKITLPQLLVLLENNWEGNKALQLKIRHDPEHFGNNRESDSVAVSFIEDLAEYINRRPNGRGGFYTTALHSADWFIKFGTNVGATPDGRSAGEELTKNISPRQGGSFNGPSALLSSVLKFDPSLFPGDFPVDVMIPPGTVAGDAGLAVMRSLLMTYIKKGGGAIHFNIFNSRLLEDARKYPERYSDLQVRVCGWNVLWNTLSDKEQIKYLEQALANDNGAEQKAF